MTEPFKVRLTGSSAGTLEQVLVQIELVDRAPLQCPAPWAWYRGDDLVGTTGDTVTQWDDRTGNGRHLIEDPGWITVPSIDAGIDGIRGLTGTRSTFQNDRLLAEYDAYEFSAGKTIFIVFKPQADSFFQAATASTPGGSTLWQLIWGDGGATSEEQFLSSNAGGSVWTFDPAPSGAQAVMIRTANGQPHEVTYAGGTDLSTAGGGTVGSATKNATWNVHEVAIRQGEVLCEWIVFDTLLTPECVAKWQAYLAARFPSLF